MLSELEQTAPSGAAQESPHIKMEPEEPQPAGVSQEARAQGARGWEPPSRGSKEKACVLPGGGEGRSPRGAARLTLRGCWPPSWGSSRVGLAAAVAAPGHPGMSLLGGAGGPSRARGPP